MARRTIGPLAVVDPRAILDARCRQYCCSAELPQLWCHGFVSSAERPGTLQESDVSQSDLWCCARVRMIRASRRRVIDATAGTAGVVPIDAPAGAGADSA